jgi:hypothetical protein
MSFKLEVLQGANWETKTAELRFASEQDAAEYAKQLRTRLGVTDPIRVQESDDPANCKMDGGIGNRHLVFLNSYREGQLWIEGLIERLLSSQAMRLDAPIKWTPNIDHQEFILEASMSGVLKVHKISYADVEDAASDSTVRQRLEKFLTTYWIPDAPNAGLRNVGNLPEDIHTAPVDREKYWSILDQTKAEMRKAGRPGIVLLDKEDADYKAKMAAFLAKFNHTWDAKKPFLVIQHDTQSKELFEAAKKAGLDAELI